MDTSTPSYQIDSKWMIVAANEAFCRAFRCAEAGLIGRDVRDLLRPDWRLDFRTYVARALVGIGETDVTLPRVAPCGDQGWYKHSLEPIMTNGLLTGYRASVVPHVVQQAAPVTRWWHLRAPRTVWNFETEPVQVSQSIAA
jgi:PAS domain-containing protein